MEVFSPPQSPEVDSSVAKDHGGPEPYRFKLGVEHVVRRASGNVPVACIHGSVSLSRDLLPSAASAEPYDGLKGKNSARCVYKLQNHKSKPLHQN